MRDFTQIAETISRQCTRARYRATLASAQLIRAQATLALITNAPPGIGSNHV